MTQVSWRCVYCNSRMSDKAELMGMRVRCECGMKMIAPVDWTDLQGFVLICTIGIPLVAFMIKQAWWLWLRWTGFAGLALLFVFMFWALPREGHESAITSLLRGHVVGAVVLALAALTGLFYREAEQLVQAFEYFPDLGEAPGLFFSYALLDIVSVGWLARLVFHFQMHLFAMVRYPGPYFAPIVIAFGTALFAQAPNNVVKVIGAILIAASLLILLKPRAIGPVPMLANEILDFDFSRDTE